MVVIPSLLFLFACQGDKNSDTGDSLNASTTDTASDAASVDIGKCADPEYAATIPVPEDAQIVYVRTLNLTNTSGDKVFSDFEQLKILYQLTTDWNPNNTRFVLLEEEAVTDNDLYESVNVASRISQSDIEAALDGHTNPDVFNIFSVGYSGIQMSSGFHAGGYCCYEDNTIVLGNGGDNVATHETGHWKGLDHTHKGTKQAHDNDDLTSADAEWVNGDNGSTAGDKIPGTHADPGNTYCDPETKTCTVQDVNGEDYDPPWDNAMAYYGGMDITDDQYARANCFAQTPGTRVNDRLSEAGDGVVSNYTTVGFGTDAAGSIQEAINLTADDGVVEIWPGTYDENVFIIGRKLTIRKAESASSDDPVIINGNAAGSAVMIYESDVSLSGVEAINGYADDTLYAGGTGGGGGFYVESSTVTLDRVLVADNYSERNGGGMAVYDSVVTLTDSSFESNETVSHYGGGIYCNGSILTADELSLSGNSADTGGGGLYADECDVDIADSTIEGNKATVDAGLAFHESEVQVQGSLFSSNVAETSGGGLGFYSESTTLYLTDNTFSGNEAPSSGSALALKGLVEIENNVITNHVVGDRTVQVYSSDNCIFNGNDFYENANQALYLQGALCTFSAGTISGNTTTDSYYNGVVYVYGSEVTFNGVDWNRYGSNESYDVQVGYERIDLEDGTNYYCSDSVDEGCKIAE